MFRDLVATRIMADPDVLDAVALDTTSRCLRLAPDDLLMLGPASVVVDAVIVEDETGLCSARVRDRSALAERCPWPLPAAGVVRGGIDGIGVILVVDEDGVLVIVEAPFAHDLGQRLAPVLEGPDAHP